MTKNTLIVSWSDPLELDLRQFEGVTSWWLCACDLWYFCNNGTLFLLRQQRDCPVITIAAATLTETVITAINLVIFAVINPPSIGLDEKKSHTTLPMTSLVI